MADVTGAALQIMRGRNEVQLKPRAQQEIPTGVAGRYPWLLLSPCNMGQMSPAA